MSDSSADRSVSNRRRLCVVFLLIGYAGIGHFNRVAVSVAGTEVFIRDASGPATAAAPAPAATAAATAAAADSPTRPAAPPARTAPATHPFEGTLTETQMGWVYTAFLIVYTCAMMPGGWWIDRVGASRALTGFGLAMGGFVALTGVLGWLAGSPLQLWLGLLVVRGLAGFCSAPLHPGAAHIVADVASPRGRATVNGLVTAGALVGIAFCYPVFGRLIDEVSWPAAFLLCGGVMIGYAVVWSFVSRGVVASETDARHASSVRRATTGESDSIGDAQANGGARTGGRRATVPWHVLRSRDLWVLMGSYVAYGYFQYLFFYWMAYYFEKVLHVPEVESRRAAFVIALAQGAGMILGGMSNDLICRKLGAALGRRIIVLTGMVLSGAFALVAIGLSDAAQVALFMALAMGAQGMCESIFWTTATEIGGRDRGFAGAFMNAGGNVGGFISPVLTPILAEDLGWPAAIAAACVFCAAGGLMWFWIRLPDSGPSTAPA